MGVSRFFSRYARDATEVAEGLVAPMALFKEWVAIHVVSIAFPEAWLVGVH
jgi:hypothetical protein